MRLRRSKQIEISYSGAAILLLAIASLVLWAYTYGTIAGLDRC